MSLDLLTAAEPVLLRRMDEGKAGVEDWDFEAEEVHSDAWTSRALVSSLLAVAAADFKPVGSDRRLIR